VDDRVRVFFVGLGGDDQAWHLSLPLSRRASSEFNSIPG
jgi:hypothetical protein